MNTRLITAAAFFAIAAVPAAISYADPEPTVTAAPAPAAINVCSPEAQQTPHEGTYACNSSREPFSYPWMGDR